MRPVDSPVAAFITPDGGAAGADGLGELEKRRALCSRWVNVHRTVAFPLVSPRYLDVWSSAPGQRHEAFASHLRRPSCPDQEGLSHGTALGTVPWDSALRFRARAKTPLMA